MRALPFVLAVVLALLAGAAREHVASVAFDLRGLSAAEYRRLDGLALERKVALRLVQEGFAAVAPGPGADVEVRVSMGPAGLDLSAARGGRVLQATIAVAAGATAEWHLEVAHKTAELARALLGSATAAEVEGEPAAPARASPAAAAPAAGSPPLPSAVDARPAGAPASSQQPSPSPWEVGAGLGGLWRAGGADPLVGVLATNARGRLRLHLDAFGTRSTGDGIEVLEGQGAAGIGVAVLDGPLAVDVGLGGGAVIQRYSSSSAWAAAATGTRTSPAMWAPIRARWAGRHLVVAARVAAGVTRSFAHTSQGATLWSRGALRLEAMLVVGWAF